MLSDRENIHRMRCKLVENDDFNKHDEASRLRDNLGIDSIDESRQFCKLLQCHRRCLPRTRDLVRPR